MMTIKELKENALHNWDMWVYELSFKSINRLCESNPAIAYLFQLWIHEWLEKNPLSDTVKKSTESFFDACRDHDDKGDF